MTTDESESIAKKPELTGLSPQQIADYVEVMNRGTVLISRDCMGECTDLYIEWLHMYGMGVVISDANGIWYRLPDGREIEYAAPNLCPPT